MLITLRTCGFQIGTLRDLHRAFSFHRARAGLFSELKLPGGHYQMGLRPVQLGFALGAFQAALEARREAFLEGANLLVRIPATLAPFQLGKVTKAPKLRDLSGRLVIRPGEGARYERASGEPWRALVAHCLGVEVGTADTEEAAVGLIQERLEGLVGVDPFEDHVLRRGGNAWWNK